MTRSTLCCLVLLLALPAPAAVPGEINFQGLLLDSGGSPVTGSADLVFTLFDVPSGGSPIWTETHPGVPVLDGVYDVVLGSTTPITPGLIAGGVLHLEISVDGETLSPRQRLVAVPYAVRAATAESAASADTVQGLDGTFVLDIFEHFAFDGADPPNQDPSEGVADADLDGLPNFLDPDNDDDGLSDADELAQGSDINLVTPIVSGFDPEPAEASVTSTVQVQGTNFAGGLAVAFGSESPAPQNVTATDFDVDVGPQSEGSVNVVVTLPNAESDARSFQFLEHQPVLTDITPDFTGAAETGVVTLTGSGFAPGLEVSFGSENPVPQNLTSTSFDVTVGPQSPGIVSVVASYPSGKQDSIPFEFLGSGVSTVFVSSAEYNGNLGGIAGADAKCQSLADAVPLSGTFVAWLGDSTTDPASRFTVGGAYFRVDDTLVASTFASLTDGSLGAAIDRDENDAPVAALAWTNVAADGTSLGASESCSDWGATAGQGRTGDVTAIDNSWTESVATPCSTSRRLYCFEQ